MHKLVLLLSAFLLAGCTDSDWAHFVPGTGDNVVVAAAPPPSETTMVNYQNAMAGSRATTEGCARTARERSDDVAQQGFDDATRLQVYDDEYANCMKWAMRAGR